MQYVYALKAKYKDHTLVKIGKTTRSPHQRLAEINESWGRQRGITWTIARVMTVWNCHEKEMEMHRKWEGHRYTSKEISKWLGGRCDGDSEIFNLSWSERQKLYSQMSAGRWGLDGSTKAILVLAVLVWLMVGIGRSQAPRKPAIGNRMKISYNPIAPSMTMATKPSASTIS